MTSLTTALPLTRGIDNQLQFLIIDYFTNENVWTSQVFSNAQYAYVKDDLASKQRPSLFCYPRQSKKDSFGYSQRGIIVLELHVSLFEQRTYLAQNVIQIANLIQLINLNHTLTDYCQNSMPGLLWLGKEFTTDYSQVYQKEAVVKMEMDYNVDLVAYKNGLVKLGCDITSPDEQIYQQALYLQQQIAVLDENLDVAFTV
jgi:hypothetical protein